MSVMAMPVVLDEMPKNGYRYVAAISYRDGNTYRLCGCTTKKAAEKVCDGWLKRAKKSICADVLLRE